MNMIKEIHLLKSIFYARIKCQCKTLNHSLNAVASYAVLDFHRANVTAFQCQHFSAAKSIPNSIRIVKRCHACHTKLSTVSRAVTALTLHGAPNRILCETQNTLTCFGRHNRRPFLRFYGKRIFKSLNEIDLKRLGENKINELSQNGKNRGLTSHSNVRTQG